MMIFMYGFVLFMSYIVMKITKDEKQKKEFENFLIKKKVEKDKNIHVLPWIFFIFPPILNITSLFIIIFTIFFIPIYVYVKIYGPLGPDNIVSNFLGSIKYPLIFFFIFGVGLSWYHNPKLKILKKFKKIETWPIKRWIIKNITCPECSGSLEKCNYKTESSETESLEYECFCKECNKKITITCDGRHAKFKK